MTTAILLIACFIVLPVALTAFCCLIVAGLSDQRATLRDNTAWDNRVRVSSATKPRKG